MENEMMTLLKQMNEKIEKMDEKMNEKFEIFERKFERFEAKFEIMDKRLDRHEQLLQQIITMTAKNTEDITALRIEMTQRCDSLELSDYRTKADINLLFQEIQTNKREIAQLKS